MRAIILTTLLTILPPLLLPAWARAEDAQTDGREMVWDGYLFRDPEGRVRLGWPVIAMGVMEQPAHVVAPPAAKRLAPLVTDVRDDYAFWNYDLERAGDGPLKGIPRVLVRLRGRVTMEEVESTRSFHRGGTRTMHDARLLTVEFLDETWLRRWAAIFRDQDSVFRIDLERGTITEEEKQGFARRAVSMLKRMYAVGKTSEDSVALSRRIDPEARVVQTHRRRSQWALQRWLLDMETKHDLGLAGLDALPAPPPASVELQRWFLETETKAAFLAKVAEAWSGDLAALELPHYVDKGSSTTYVRADLEEIRLVWTEDEYRARRAATQRLIGR